MKIACLSAVLTVALCGCGTIIKAPVSPQELAKVNKVGVAAAFKDQFHGRQIALTAFGNEKFDLDVPAWNLNRMAQSRTIDILKQGNPRLQVQAIDVPPIERIHTDKEVGWLSAAQQQGLDTVLVLEPNVSSNYLMFTPGVGIFKRFQLTCIYTAYTVNVYDVATRKRIAWEWGASPPCKMEKSDPDVTFKADPAQYSAAELEAMRRVVDAKFAQTLPEALGEVGLIPEK